MKKVVNTVNNAVTSMKTAAKDTVNSIVSGVKGFADKLFKKSEPANDMFPINLQLFADKKVKANEVSDATRKDFRDAKRAAGIPTSQTHTTHKFVNDKQYENRTVYEFDINRGSSNSSNKYIIKHEEDRFGRGTHYHGADGAKGNPMRPGKYNQYDGHFPED